MASSGPQDFGQPLVLEDFMSVEQPVSASSAPLCNVCHKSVQQSKRCSGCKNITYCSKDCQMNDWEQHKLVSKPFTKSTSPGPDYRRALFLSPDKTRAHFVWLKYGTDGAPINITSCFANRQKKDLRTIAFHNRFLPYWIQLSYDSNPEANRALSSNLLVQHAFRGPVVAIAYDPEGGLSQPALDVDTATLAPVRDYAKLRAEYEGPIFVEQPQERYTEEEWTSIVNSALSGQV